MRVRQGQAIDQEQKLDFLDFFRQGYPRPEAAKKVDQSLTGSQFRKLCNPESIHYDERFARMYHEIEESGEHEANRLEMLQTAAFKRALLESDRLLEKLLIIHDPDWAVHRPNRVDVQIDIRSFVQQHFGHLTAEQTRQLIEWAEKNPEADIIDAPALHELEPAK